MKTIKYLLITILILFATQTCFESGSELYPWPTFWSLGDLASWSQPLIASGTTLPNVADATEGNLYIVSGKAVYRFESGSWFDIGKKHDFIQLEKIATPTPEAGIVFSSSDDDHLYYFNGSEWKQLDN